MNIKKYSLILFLLIAFFNALAGCSFQDFQGAEDQKYNTFNNRTTFLNSDYNNVFKNGLTATYLNQSWDSKIFERIESHGEINWGGDYPIPGNVDVPKDNFNVKLTGYIKPDYSEDYTFYLVADDNARLWVSNVLVTNWRSGGTEGQGTILLKAGKLHTISIEYSEYTGNASMQLYWESPSQAKEIVPNANLFTYFDDEDGDSNDNGNIDDNDGEDNDSDDNGDIDDNAGDNDGDDNGDVADNDGEDTNSNNDLINGLHASYYDTNLNLKILDRIEPVIDIDWGGGHPIPEVPEIPVDSFNVNFTGFVKPKFSEEYTFYMIADNDARVWINNELIIDWMPNWTYVGKEKNGTIFLEAGKYYSIEIEYYEHMGGASIYLSWASPSQRKEIIPNTCLFANYNGEDINDNDGEDTDDQDDGEDNDGNDNGNIDENDLTHGLNAAYYKGFWDVKILERIEEIVDIDWGGSFPIPENTAIPMDGFSVRFTGSLKPKFTEDYTFYMIADNDAQVWIDNNQIIFPNPDWTYAGKEKKGTMSLEGGKFYDITIEYMEHMGGASIQFYWESPSQAREIIPNSCLFTYYDEGSIDLCPEDPDKIYAGSCGCGAPDTDSDNDGSPDCKDQCPADPNKTGPQYCGCGNSEFDWDHDGSPDCVDLCPHDKNKTKPGICGCGKIDVDNNHDNICDSEDLCPNDPNKTNPGICGCGTPDTDSDKDGIADCKDGCPNDPNKTSSGVCGCGTADTDSDHDGTPNCNDQCPNDPKKTQPGICGCGQVDIDNDHDNVCDSVDQCPNDPNKTNPGMCGCGTPDTDSDKDGTPDCKDQCPNDPNKTSPGKCGCGNPETPTCGASNAGKTVFTTAGASDLDTSDRIDFRNGVVQGGYTNLGDIYNVSASQFSNVLQRSDIKVLFMASHGAPGAVWCTTSGLNCSNMPAYSVENVIYSTCSTLGDTCLKSKMGPSSQTILGYTNTTWDGIANQMAKKMSSNIITGQSYIKSWYAANVSISQLKDRWCGYVREGSNIVEYSARSGKIPRDVVINYESLDLAGMVSVNNELLYDTRDFDTYYSELKVHYYTYLIDGDHEVNILNNQAEFLLNERATLSDEEAIEIATDFLVNSLPVDAVVDSVDMIDKDGFQIAHRVRFVRQKNGLPIHGNYEEHHIEVLINDGKVIAISRLWPAMVEYSGSSYASLLTVQETIDILGNYLVGILRSPIKITSVSPCYGNDNTYGNIVPAHCYEDETNATWVINAETGEFIE